MAHRLWLRMMCPFRYSSLIKAPWCYFDRIIREYVLTVIQTFILYSLTCRQNFSTVISIYVETKPHGVMQWQGRWTKTRSSVTYSKKWYNAIPYGRDNVLCCQPFYEIFSKMLHICPFCLFFLFKIHVVFWKKGRRRSFGLYWWKRKKMLPPTGQQELYILCKRHQNGRIYFHKYQFCTQLNAVCSCFVLRQLLDM